MDGAAERTGWFAAATAAVAALVAALVLTRAEPVAPRGLIAATAIPWLGLGIALRLRRHTWGREGRYVDLWSVTHVVAGGLLGMVGIGLVWVVALVIAWELIEIACRVAELPGNRVVDVVLALAAWPAAQGAFAGPFPLC